MRRAFLAAAVWLLLVSSARATTLFWMDVRGLTRNSTSVVMGTVVSQTHLGAGPGVPLSRITFEISRTLKGDIKETVLVDNPGFPGAPAFVEGDEYILFIHTRHDTHVITGFQQGSFRIFTDPSGERVLDRRIPSQLKSAAGDRSVDRLVSEILDAAE